MDEREALLRAAVANPDDDLPRLIYADWLEEHDDPDQAAFVRAQCELAATPPWEPFAVRCRARHPDWVAGRPWRSALPAVDGRLLEWHPEFAFRRGLGWGLVVRQLSAFLDAAPRLFDAAPLGQLHLPTATLDEWKRFARQPWLPRVRSVHFFGTTTPIEPVRILCDTERATGVEEVVFEMASGAGMPMVVERLMEAQLGRQLKRIELRVGPDEPEDLLRALAFADPEPRLDRLALVTMPAAHAGLAELYDSPVLSRLTDLELANIPQANPPWLHDKLPILLQLRAARCALNGFETAALARSPTTARLRAVDLSDNPVGGWEADGIPADPNGLPAVRSLNLRRTLFPDATVGRWLTGAAFWPNLVELDLRDNHLTDAGAAALMDAPIPSDLTALWLGGNRISDPVADRLRDHFGKALSFDVGEIGPGLR